MSVMSKIAKSAAVTALAAIPAALGSKSKSKDIFTIAGTLVLAVVAMAIVKDE